MASIRNMATRYSVASRRKLIRCELPKIFAPDLPTGRALDFFERGHVSADRLAKFTNRLRVSDFYPGPYPEDTVSFEIFYVRAPLWST